MKNLFLKRSLAYLTDCIIAFSFVMLFFQWAILSNIRGYMGITDEWFKNSFNMEFYVLFSISLPVWIYFSYFDSNKAKGTFGKRIFKLTVSDNIENKRITLKKSFIRTILKLLPWEIAHIGVIFPTPLYFIEQPEIRILTILGMSLFIGYILSILLNSKGRSWVDLITNTQVQEDVASMRWT